jgi:hypothetical protein
MFCNLNASPSAIAPTRQAENSSRASSNLAEWGQAPRGVTPRSRSRTRLLDFHTSFTRRLIEIADVAGARGSGSSPTTTLNAMRLPAIAHDQHGFVADVNAAAEVVFDNDIKIKDRRLFVRDPDARTLLKNAVDRLKELLRLDSLALEPVIVPRTDKLPVIMRIWPFEGRSHPPGQDVRALLTLNALGPRPGPPAAILAKTFRLIPTAYRMNDYSVPAAYGFRDVLHEAREGCFSQCHVRSKNIRSEDRRSDAQHAPFGSSRRRLRKVQCGEYGPP